MQRATASRFAAVYVLVCLVLSVLYFVPQESSAVLFVVLFVVMLPISLTAYAITYFGGLVVFGVGDWPTWARVAVAIFWTALAAAQAFGFLALLWRARSSKQRT